MRSLHLLLISFLCIGTALHAETVRERLKRDPDFQLYAVIFAIVQNDDATVKSVTIANIFDAASDSKETASVQLPKAYFEKAEALIRSHKYALQAKEGKPITFFAYYLYSPELGDRVIDDPDAPVMQK
ncbi:MAG: hypothetical protein ABIP97_12125 [Chthoniobacterales bacterium]